MHCSCCDKLLDNEESTARFVTERNEPLRYVEMCRTCRSFLPPEVRIITRNNFGDDVDVVDEYFENESEENYGFDDHDE